MKVILNISSGDYRLGAVCFVLFSCGWVISRLIAI